MTPSEVAATAQRILDDQGYLVLADWVSHPVGQIVPSAHFGKLPGPMKVIAGATRAEWVAQHRQYAPRDLPPDPCGASYFVKVVAE